MNAKSEAYPHRSEISSIIADVAQELITNTPASSHVKELLGSYTMSEVSTWADKIKGGSSPDADLNAWRDANRNTPAGKSSARKEPSTSFRGTSPKVALILLIHYAAI